MSDKFTLSVGLAHQLELGINRNEGKLEHVQWLCQGENFAKVATLAEYKGRVVLNEPPPPKPNDIISHIDYPEWVAGIVFSELENSGPAEYKLGNIKLWQYKPNNLLECRDMFMVLKEKDMIKNCLGLWDLQQIEKKGYEMYRKFFNKKRIFAWKSVVTHVHFPTNFVPCLSEEGGCMKLEWEPFFIALNKEDMVALHA